MPPPICHNSFYVGRYRLSRRKWLVEEYFDCASGEEDWTPRYNIAPTQPVPVIRQNPKEPVREVSLMRWGLHSLLRENFACQTIFQLEWKDASMNRKGCASRSNLTCVVCQEEGKNPLQSPSNRLFVYPKNVQNAIP